jgi:multiple sugar transport system substrate-binding protein
LDLIGVSSDYNKKEEVENMKKSFALVLVFILSLTMLLSACGKDSKTDDAKSDTSTSTTDTTKTDDATEPAAEAPKDLSGKLTIWTFAQNTHEKMNEAFQKKYPNVQLDFQILSWDDMQKNLKNALATGAGGPDVAMIEGGWFASMNSGEGLEDLLAAPYNAGELKDKFTDANWQRWHSLDGKKLLGLPWDIPPMVTFYRPDILEENGFPSDPVQLGEYIANEDNFLSMAQALKAKGIYILENNDTIFNLYTSGEGFFDRSLNYLRNNEKFAHGLDLAKKVKQLDLAFKNCALWCDPGKQALASGKIAMLYYGGWATGAIKGAAPDTVGKWRTTTLPFGTTSANGGSTMAILSQSKNKELAWEYLKFCFATDEGQRAYVEQGGSPGYIPAWSFPEVADKTNEMLGDQKYNQIWNPLAQKINTLWVSTPFDADASDIFNKGIADAIDKNTDSKAVLQKIQDDVEAKVKVKRDELKAKLGIQ